MPGFQGCVTSSRQGLSGAMNTRNREYQEPGGLIHLDIKKLGRFERVGHSVTKVAPKIASDRGTQGAWVGIEPWSATGSRTMARVHVLIDDRIAVTGIYPDEKPVTTIAAIRAAMARYQTSKSR